MALGVWVNVTGGASCGSRAAVISTVIEIVTWSETYDFFDCGGCAYSALSHPGRAAFYGRSRGSALIVSVFVIGGLRCRRRAIVRVRVFLCFSACFSPYFCPYTFWAETRIFGHHVVFCELLCGQRHRHRFPFVVSVAGASLHQTEDSNALRFSSSPGQQLLYDLYLSGGSSA